MGLSKGVTTNDKSSSLLIIHTHTVKRHTDIKSRSLGIGATIRTLGVDVDQTVVSSTKRLLKLVGAVVNVGATIVADIVTLGNESSLSTPVDRLISLPGVGTTASETKRLKVHALEGDVAGEEVEIGPRDLVAVLLLDGP